MTSQLAWAIPLRGASTCRVLDHLLDEPFPRVDVRPAPWLLRFDCRTRRAGDGVL